MTCKVKSTHFFFCFHPRYDTGTWTIATAFAALMIFAVFFVMTLSYAVPTCACSTFYDHLTILPAVPTAIYIGVLIFFALLVASSIMAIYGTFKAQHRKLPLYIILLVVTEVSVFVGSIFIFILLARFEEYLLFDNETYVAMARLIVKEEIFEHLEVIVNTLSVLVLRLEIGFTLEEVLNLDQLMDAALKEEVIIVLGGMKQLMKVSVSLILTGFNAFLITAILTASSHFYRLKTGKSRHFTGVPEMVIHKAVLSDSIKSTPSDSLSDISGIPMTQLPPTRSRGARDSTARNSARIYTELSRNGSSKYHRGEVLTRTHNGTNGKTKYQKGHVL